MNRLITILFLGMTLSASVPAFSVVIDDTILDTTAILSTLRGRTTAAGHQGTTPVYDLQGRKVAADANEKSIPLPPGIYIVNGKKVVR